MIRSVKGEDISIRELAGKIALATKYKGKILWNSDKPDGTPKKQLDISNLKKLGWNPRIGLDEGIKKTVKDYELQQVKN